MDELYQFLVGGFRFLGARFFSVGSAFSVVFFSGVMA
jgi:hypothetical protein